MADECLGERAGATADPRPCARARAEPEALARRPRRRPRHRRPARLGRLLRGHGRQGRPAAHLPLPAPALLARPAKRRRGPRRARPGHARAPAARRRRSRTPKARASRSPAASPCRAPLAGRPRRRRHRDPARHRLRGAGAQRRRAGRCAERSRSCLCRRRLLPRRDAGGAAGRARRARRGGQARVLDPLPPRRRRSGAVDPARQRHPRRGRARRARAARRVAARRGRAARGRGPMRPPRRGRLRLRPRLPGPDAAWQTARRSTPRLPLPEERSRSRGLRDPPGAARRAAAPRSPWRRRGRQLRLPFAWRGVSPQRRRRQRSCGCGSPQARASRRARARRRAAAPRSAWSSSATSRPFDPAAAAARRRGPERPLRARLAGAAELAGEETRAPPSARDLAPTPATAHGAEGATLRPAREAPGLPRRGEDEDTRLAFLTQGAVATQPRESPDPAAAALWGLVRSAQPSTPAASP